VIRLFVWLVVALSLLGIFYKILGRGGVNQEALRNDQRHLAQPGQASGPPGVVAAVDAFSDKPRPIGYGLSFAFANEPGLPQNVAHLNCHGDPAPADRPHRGSCNPYDGDTSCRVVLPIACFRSSGAAAPQGLEQNFYKGWTHGQLGATEPVMGAILKSEPAASARCEAELGAGWRMAEFHDGGGGWGLQGERRKGLRPLTRYWVYINDQRGNCWDSKP